MLLKNNNYFFIFSFFHLFLTFLFINARSQTIIKGHVYDFNTKNQLTNINVFIKEQSDQGIIAFCFTDSVGNYSIQLNKLGKFEIHFSALGFRDTFERFIIENPNEVLIINSNLVYEYKTLNEVIVETNTAIISKGDTTIIDPKYFTIGNERSVEEVLKKLPGIYVTEDGKIKIKNKEIAKVLVEGDDFLEYNYQLLTRNMQGNAVDKIEVIDRFSENHLLKNIEISDKIILNLKLKDKFKLKIFGNGFVGYDPIIKDRYQLGLTLQSYSKKTKFFITSYANNIGQNSAGDVTSILSNYNSDDYNNLGNDIKTFTVLPLSPNTINIGKARTGYNKNETVSLNFIFNPTPKFKIKPSFFLNWDYSNISNDQQQSYILNQFSFTNNQNTQFINNQFNYSFKLELNYDLNTKQSLKYIGQISNSFHSNNIDLIFNNLKSVESNNITNPIFSHNLLYTWQINKKNALLISGRIIQDNRPQNYYINQFYFNDLFQNTDTLLHFNITRQSTNYYIQFWGLEANLLIRRTESNFFNFSFGIEKNKQTFYNLVNSGNDSISNFNYNLYENNFTFYYTKFNFKFKSEFKIISKLNILAEIEFAPIFNKLDFNRFQENINLFRFPLLDTENVNQILPNSNFLTYKSLLGLKYLVNKKGQANLIYSLENKIIDFTNLIPIYYLSDFRSLTKGLGQLQQIQSHNIIVNFNYGTWGDKNVFFSNILTYSPYFLGTNSLYSPLNNIIKYQLFHDNISLITLIQFNYYLKK